MAYMMVDEIVGYRRFTLKETGFQTIALTFGHLGGLGGMKKTGRGEQTWWRTKIQLPIKLAYSLNPPARHTAEKSRQRLQHGLCRLNVSLSLSQYGY
jgi:hypothetical protein